MGLMARHIAYIGEHPVFIYGQNYMGSLEAHIGAVFFFIFGPSLFSLRLSLVILYAALLISLYLLTSLLYSKKFALALLVLLSLGSVELLTRQLKAVGGAEETMLFGSLLVLLSAWLVLPFQQEPLHVTMRRRLFVYGCYGLVMGLGMWSHMLILPFAATTLVLLVFFCYRELRLPVLASFGFGLLLGFSPSLVFTLEHPSQNFIGTLWQLHSSGGTATTVPFTLWDSIRGTVLVSLPMATGASPQCPVPDTPGVWRAHITPCLLIQGIWGVGFLLLYSTVLLLTVRALVKYSMRKRVATPSDSEQRSMRYHAVRLTLLASGGLTLLSYIVSPAPALVPLTSTRYLVGLVVMFPALLAPLWEGVSFLWETYWKNYIKKYRVKKYHERPQGDYPTIRSVYSRVVPLWASVNTNEASVNTNQASKDVNGASVSTNWALVSTFWASASSLLLLLVYLVYSIAIVGVFQQVPSVQAINKQQEKLVGDLIGLHATHIYSDYWTCNRVVFQSNEKIICSSLNEQLQPQDNRYPPYQTIVEGDAQAAYVFPVGSSQAKAFAQRVVQDGSSYQRVEIDNYVVYKLL